MGPSQSPEQDATALARQHRAEFARIALENHFAISPDAILVTDATGVIREANPRAVEMFGYERGELIGMPVEMLVPHASGNAIPSHRENFNAHPRTRRWVRPEPLCAAQGRHRVSRRHHAAADRDRNRSRW